MINASHRPKSLWEFFLSFTLLGLQGFGGVLTVVQRELVDKRQWLSLATFAEEWALAQTLPGPNVVNLSVMLGNRFFGPWGSVVAASGLLLAPGLLMLLVVYVFQSLSSFAFVQHALHGMGVTAAGMVVAAGCRFFPLLRQHVLGWPMAFALAGLSAFLAVVWHWPLLQVISSVGLLSCVACGWRLNQGSPA